MINTPVVTALNVTTYTAITLPSSNRSFRDLSIWTEDGSSWIMAVDLAGTGAAVVPINTPFSIGGQSKDGTVLLYAKAVVGTPNLVVYFKRSQT